MHTALKAAMEEQALRSMAKDLAEIKPRLEGIERQNAEILDLLKAGQHRGHIAPAPSPNARGGR